MACAPVLLRAYHRVLSDYDIQSETPILLPYTFQLMAVRVYFGPLILQLRSIFRLSLPTRQNIGSGHIPHLGRWFAYYLGIRQQAPSYSGSSFLRVCFLLTRYYGPIISTTAFGIEEMSHSGGPLSYVRGFLVQPY